MAASPRGKSDEGKTQRSAVAEFERTCENVRPNRTPPQKVGRSFHDYRQPRRARKIETKLAIDENLYRAFGFVPTARSDGEAATWGNLELKFKSR